MGTLPFKVVLKLRTVPIADQAGKEDRDAVEFLMSEVPLQREFVMSEVPLQREFLMSEVPL